MLPQADPSPSDLPIAESLVLRADAPLFIVHNAGSGRSCAEERQRLIRQILTAAGRQCTFSLVADPRHLVAQA